jgi:hypothetical protein
MANLSADAPLRIWGPAHTERFHCDSSGTYTIYKGCGLVIDANVDTINAHTAASLTLVDGDVFLGIAAEKKVVTSGDSETDANSMVEAYVGPTIVGFKSAVFTNADLGKAVGMSDTGTLIAYGAGVFNPASSGGAYPRIGRLHRVEDGYAYVELDSPFVIEVT